MVSLGAELVFWIVLPALVALGAAYIVWLLMQARIQVLTAHYETAVAKVQNDCEVRRPGMDELLSELRLERRRFLRRLPGPNGLENTLITHERLFYRNIPLTNWMQDEIPLGQGEEVRPEPASVPLIAPAIAVQLQPECALTNSPRASPIP